MSAGLRSMDGDDTATADMSLKARYRELIAFVHIIGTGLLLALGLIYLCRNRRHNDKRKIPGPRGWPLLGNAPALDPKYPHVTMTKWAKQYGDVYQLNLLGEKVIVASGKDDIRDILIYHSDDFAGLLLR